MKLNLGCGKDWRSYPGFIGIDIVDFGQEYVDNIERDGLHFHDDGSVEEIMAFNVLEHIAPDRMIFVMNECWRVLKMGGKFHIKVPLAPSENAFSDPTHRSFWTRKTFTEYFAGGSPRNADYGIKKWGIMNDGKGNYLMELSDREIDIWLYKR